jgi:hypothetical protein
MNKILSNIELINKIVNKHERYTHFSGAACIITGVIWLINEYLGRYFHFSDGVRILSWIIVVLIAVTLAAYLTFQARQKEGKEKVTLSLLSVLEKLLIISIATLALIYVLYTNGLLYEIPGLLLLMYGTLILMSKEHITEVIKYFGYLNVIGGIGSFLAPSYSLPIAWAIIGGGHIVLGIILIVLKKKNS